MSSTVIAHDYFAIRGGGERLILTLAQALDSPVLVFGYRDDESYELDMFPAHIENLDLPMRFRYSGLRAAALAARFWMQRRDLSKYSLRIFSGVAAPFSAPDKSDFGRNIYYCHTPPRFLYDQKHRFASEGANHVARSLAVEFFRRGYEASVARMNTIIANSQTVRKRIAHYLGYDSTVVYPPCDVKRFVWVGQQNYYVSTARLSEMKRVDRIVDAFLRMPSQNLVVVSGGDQMRRLRNLADGAPNISFVGWVGEDHLRNIIGNAIASIYLPIEEDFGMSPVESMAAGKPVIGVAEGGLLETIVHGETGLLLRPDFTPLDIVHAVGSLSASKAANMRKACEARAAYFSETRFVKAMREIVSTSTP